jgi:hypothetical protein
MTSASISSASLIAATAPEIGAGSSISTLNVSIVASYGRPDWDHVGKSHVAVALLEKVRDADSNSLALGLDNSDFCQPPDMIFITYASSGALNSA